MKNNKKHVPDYEISTYSNRKPTEYTYSGNGSSANPLETYLRNHSDNHSNYNQEGGADDRDNQTNK